MSAFLLTWNPAYWDGEITNPSDWSCGNSKKIKLGDRLFLIRLGTEPRGLVASGRSLTDVFQDDEGILRVRMAIDTLLDFEVEEIFSRESLALLNAGLQQPMNWSARISGTQIPEVVASRLEEAWRTFLSGRLPPADEVRQAFLYREGAVRQLFVNAYERDPRARRKCIEHFGAACSVCEMQFGLVYGTFAESFIHVHHLKPLSEIGKQYEVDPVAGLRPVCPNCHAMIHLGGEVRSIETVKAHLAANRGTRTPPV